MDFEVATVQTQNLSVLIPLEDNLLLNFVFHTHTNPGKKYYAYLLAVASKRPNIHQLKHKHFPL